jgi:hypothetical protein
MLCSMDKAHSVSTPQPAPPVYDQADAEQAARMLDQLAGMAMHRATMAAVEADDAAKAREFGLAFDRAGRGVRHMLALKLHLARKRQEMAETAATHAEGGEEGGKPPAPWWPEDGPDAGRYWHLDQSDKVDHAGWYDIETGERLDHAPWLMKPAGG